MGDHWSMATLRAASTLRALMLGAALLAGLKVAPAFAQTERSGGGANAMLAQQYQQAVAEKTQLQADNQKLKSDLDAAKKELESVKRELNSAKTGSNQSAEQLRTAQAAGQASQQNFEQAKAKMDDLVGHYRDTIATLKGVETERAQLQQQLVQSKAAYDQCVQDNMALYQVNAEVLDRYAHQGAFSYLARGEPFTRIERTKIDNLVLEYRQRAQELREQPRAGTASMGSTSSANGTTAAPR